MTPPSLPMLSMEPRTLGLVGSPTMRIVSAPLAALALTAALVVDARAQDEPPVEKPVPAEAEKPAPTREVEPVRGVRYRVWMKSGRSMEGIVRAKSVFEAHDPSAGYRPANEDEDGAGVRFWFPGAQDGFIFMPLSAIDRLEELGELSAEEGRNLARARVEAAERAEKERFQIKARLEAAEAETAAKAKAAAEAEVEAGAETAEPRPAEERAEETAKDDEAGRMAALLLRFPPTRWTPESPKEIQRRKVILGLFPSDEEKAFLEVFDEWKQAYEAWAEATGDDTTEVPVADGAKGRPARDER